MPLTEKALDRLLEVARGHRMITPSDLGPYFDPVSALVSIPQGMTIESLERFQMHPSQIKQKAVLASCASFCAYVNRFKQDGTAVFIDIDKRKFVSVLDYHEPGQPSWGHHQAEFSPKWSLEWLAWKSIHTVKISQRELAEHIEARMDDLVNPEPNAMLQAALEFQANERLAIVSHQNLDNGSLQFTFQKDNVTKRVQFPHRIKIAIPIFENEARRMLEARCRYRIDGDGVIQFMVTFVQDPRTIERDALLSIAAMIREQTDGLHQYEGSC